MRFAFWLVSTTRKRNECLWPLANEILSDADKFAGRLFRDGRVGKSIVCQAKQNSRFLSFYGRCDEQLNSFLLFFLFSILHWLVQSLFYPLHSTFRLCGGAACCKAKTIAPKRTDPLKNYAFDYCRRNNENENENWNKNDTLAATLENTRTPNWNFFQDLSH